MVRGLVLIVLCATAATAAQGQTAIETKQRRACEAFAPAIGEMARTLEKEPSRFSGNTFATLATDLPKLAADAARKAQNTQEDLALRFKAHEEALKDLSYQLKACSR